MFPLFVQDTLGLQIPLHKNMTLSILSFKLVLIIHDLNKIIHVLLVFYLSICLSECGGIHGIIEMCI
jgi:hypothetical protein